jgi:hypothetical protein
MNWACAAVAATVPAPWATTAEPPEVLAGLVGTAAKFAFAVKLDNAARSE